MIIITLLAMSGCSTLSNRTQGEKLAPIFKLAAYIGTAEALSQNPEWRQAFSDASQEITHLASQETIDFVTLYAAISKLPVKELKSDRATILITSANILLMEFSEGPVSLDTVADLRKIAEAIRDGINIGIDSPGSS
jgi:hypothetical protein